jgi:hypothetical protein
VVEVGLVDQAAQAVKLAARDRASIGRLEILLTLKLAKS